MLIVSPGKMWDLTMVISVDFLFESGYLLEGGEN